MTNFEKQQRETEEMIRRWNDEKSKIAKSAKWTLMDEIFAMIDWRDATHQDWRNVTQQGATKC